MDKKIEELIQKIREHAAKIMEHKSASKRERFLLHLESLGHWENEPKDYPEDTKANFPETVHVAYAVCHPNCGRQELIIEGSTQECQDCGQNMFRIETKEYVRKN
jgi:hypothetical protein